MNVITKGNGEGSKNQIKPRIKTVNIAKFDYNTNRAIYSECHQLHCPNLEVQFINEFLKRDYSVIFVTLNQPYRKIKKQFNGIIPKNRKRLYFIDCVSKMCGDKGEKGVICLEKNPSLTTMSIEIQSLWKKLARPKLLFFDCSEFLLEKYAHEQVFDFMHEMIQRLQKEGMVIFCFLEGTQDSATKKKLQHLFDEVVKM